MIDIIYPLKTYTKYRATELKYSLRSVDKYLANVGKVFIITDELPEWITGVEMIFNKDYNGSKYKEYNIACKICSACLDERVSDPFLFMNDDHYLLAEYDATQFPYYYYGIIADRIRARKPGEIYRISCENTERALVKHHRDTKYFDVHCPIIYKKSIANMISRFKGWTECGYVIKSLYGNMHNIEGVEMPDLKMKPPLNVDAVHGRQWFSNCNLVIKEGFFDMLEMIYPEPSRWEKTV